MALVVCCSVSATEPLVKGLRDGYASGDEAKVGEFCREWENKTQFTIKQRPKQRLDIVIAVEDIYMAFAQRALKDPARQAVFVVQRSIDLVVSDELASGKNLDSEVRSERRRIEKYPDCLRIQSFGPKELLQYSKVVLLDEAHEVALLQFLSNTDVVSAGQRFQLLSSPAEETARMRFVSKHMPVLQGHWGMGWWLESFPLIEVVALNSDLDTGIVMYRENWGGGARSCKKVDGKWTVAAFDTVSWVE